MALSLNKPKLDNLSDEIWKSAERMRGKFKSYEFQNVVLPIIVIRRLECVMLKWRKEKAAELKAKQPKKNDKEIEEMVRKLEQNPQQAPFHNKSDFTMAKVVNEDPTLVDKNFRAYISGFSDNVQEIIENFKFRETIGTMVKYNRLVPILNQYKDEDLGPERLSNLEMGYIYEDLLRRFSEQSGEQAGEHFTPREVIRLMVDLLEIPIPTKHISIYDPACGTGGMLSVAEEYLMEKASTDAERKRVSELVTLHGQELSFTNYAICQADLLIKNDQQARVYQGNSLIPHDPHSKEAGDQLPESKYQFDYMLSNPPFGVEWGTKDAYGDEARRLAGTRYKAGMPRVDDGSLLFLQTMVAKMKQPKDGGSRIAVIFNGSPLSNGDCGRGESNIRGWILENDWLDAIVMLPDQLFYNTSISTYIWLLRSDKPKSHKGRVMLIDARGQFDKEPKSFGNKRNRITDDHRKWILERYQAGWEPGYSDPHVKLFNTYDFAYHKVSVVFWQTDANDQPAIITEPYTKAFTAANIRKEQDFYESELTFRVKLSSSATGDRADLAFSLGPDDSFTKVYQDALDDAFATVWQRLKAQHKDPKAFKRAAKDFLATLEADVEWTHRHYVQDDEYIPHGEDIDAFLKREIDKPIIRYEDSPQLGWEILPNKYFYVYEAPTASELLLKKFWELERGAELELQGLATEQ